MIFNVYDTTKTRVSHGTSHKNDTPFKLTPKLDICVSHGAFLKTPRTQGKVALLLGAFGTGHPSKKLNRDPPPVRRVNVKSFPQPGRGRGRGKEKE